MTAKYGWIIDKDFDPDPAVTPPSYQNAVGIMGPKNIPRWIERALRKGEGLKFQLRYEDDRHTMAPDDYHEGYPAVYEGRCLVDQPEGWDLQDEHFGPLWDFGTPNVGAVEIWYWHEDQKEWIQL